jgi:hypothetical protein
MPPLSLMGMNDDAVLWSASGFNKDGIPVVTFPVNIRVRWDEGERETTDPKGNVIMIQAAAVVDRVIPIGSRMALGTVKYWQQVFSGSIAFPPGKIFRVVGQRSISDPMSREQFRTVMLQRDKDVNPHP